MNPAMKQTPIAALLGLGLLFGCQSDQSQEVAPSGAEAPQGFEVAKLQLEKVP